ncbi:unnamed protein product [Paramecium octaurelia]|uniref:Transmembrane protein n=1 Tax=Paramecium octaurelia TaxID=43137 RepID=A0A8S1SRZ9_PAROT|nr:unnamed protein product [Paramecium octaurelia]
MSIILQIPKRDILIDLHSKISLISKNYANLIFIMELFITMLKDYLVSIKAVNPYVTILNFLQYEDQFNPLQDYLKIIILQHNEDGFQACTKKSDIYIQFNQMLFNYNRKHSIFRLILRVFQISIINKQNLNRQQTSFCIRITPIFLLIFLKLIVELNVIRKSYVKRANNNYYNRLYTIKRSKELLI